MAFITGFIVGGIVGIVLGGLAMFFVLKGGYKDVGGK